MGDIKQAPSLTTRPWAATDFARIRQTMAMSFIAGVSQNVLFCKQHTGKRERRGTFSLWVALDRVNTGDSTIEDYRKPVKRINSLLLTVERLGFRHALRLFTQNKPASKFHHTKSRWWCHDC